VFWSSWSAQGQDVVLAVLADRRQRCERCGTRRDDWGTVDADGVLHRANPAPFEAVELSCPGCEHLDLKVDSMGEQHHGRSARLRRRRRGRRGA